jgi:hypothetical protein
MVDHYHYLYFIMLLPLWVIIYKQNRKIIELMGDVRQFQSKEKAVDEVGYGLANSLNGSLKLKVTDESIIINDGLVLSVDDAKYISSMIMHFSNKSLPNK